MSVDVLAEVKFTQKERADVVETASRLGLTVDELVRRAVSFFVAECVPTHGAANQESGI